MAQLKLSLAMIFRKIIKIFSYKLIEVKRQYKLFTAK